MALKVIKQHYWVVAACNHLLYLAILDMTNKESGKLLSYKYCGVFWKYLQAFCLTEADSVSLRSSQSKAICIAVLQCAQQWKTTMSVRKFQKLLRCNRHQLPDGNAVSPQAKEQR